MTDNQLLELVIAGLDAVLAPGTLVAQNYQSTQTGATSGAAVYLHKIGDVRRGSPLRLDRYDPDADEFVHVEIQQMETTFQASTLSPDPQVMTASDLANTCAAIIGSDAMIQRLKAHNVGVLRIAQVTNPIVQNDYDQNEAEPTLDFVLTHKRELVNGVPVVTKFEANIQRV